MNDQLLLLAKTVDGHVRLTGIKDSTRLLKGFEVSGTRNFQRYFGVKVDFSRHAVTRNTLTEVRPLQVEPVPLTLTNYHLLGGVQIKDNSYEKRFKPFAHLLAGQRFDKGDFTVRVGLPGQPQMFDTRILQSTNSRFSAVVGGGLDLRMNDGLDLRAVQLDYSQTNGGAQKSLRLGVGIVFH